MRVKQSQLNNVASNSGKTRGIAGLGVIGKEAYLEFDF